MRAGEEPGEDEDLRHGENGRIGEAAEDPRRRNKTEQQPGGEAPECNELDAEPVGGEDCQHSRQ